MVTYQDGAFKRNSSVTRHLTCDCPNFQLTSKELFLGVLHEPYQSRRFEIYSKKRINNLIYWFVFELWFIYLISWFLFDLLICTWFGDTCCDFVIRSLNFDNLYWSKDLRADITAIASSGDMAIILNTTFQLKYNNAVLSNS